MLFFFVDVVTALLFCRNSTFELVVDCMCAGLKKKAGGRGRRSPPRGGGWGGAEPPPFANALASRQAKALKKRLCSISSSSNKQ